MLCLKKLKIEPLSIEGFTPAKNIAATQRLECLLQTWKGTRYLPGQCMKRKGVDCVHFLIAVYDELSGTKHRFEKLPQDVSFHNKAKAEAGFKQLLRLFPSDKIEGDIVQPGDLIVCGPIGKNGGPGHGMIVGADRLWHVGKSCVCNAGLAVMQQGTAAFKQIRRLRDQSILLRCK